MNNNTVRTFFNFAFNEKNTAAELLTLAKHLPAHAQIYVLQDSVKSVHPELKALAEQSGGKLLRIRTSGPWNNVWRLIQQLEIEMIHGEHLETGSVWFLSLIPAVEIHNALKRHRAVSNLTNREAYFLSTLQFGAEHDELIAITLNQQMGYLTDQYYKDLSVKEVFDLTSFEGQRFLRPVHDVETCAQIMSHYIPPAPRMTLKGLEPA